MSNSFKVLAVLIALVNISTAGIAPYAEGIPSFALADSEARLGGPAPPDGGLMHCCFPESLHMRNTGGSDGAGLCVMTSLEHSARWQNIESLQGYQAWAKKRPGGGYPAKVDQQITAMCKEKGTDTPHYIQIESADIEILKLVCRTRRMPAVTYGFSPTGRYAGQKIAHMVSLLHADDKWVCVLDNNFPNTYEWMTPSEFKASYISGGKTGWSVIFLAPPPPVAFLERSIGDEK